jgi:hypothetical protein
MTRPVALRVSVIFVLFSVLFASIGMASAVPAAEVLFLICGALCTVTFFFAMTVPAHAPAPVRVTRRT